MGALFLKRFINNSADLLPESRHAHSLKIKKVRS
jgi:hypothetical protein